MVRAVEGVYREGKVELLEPAPPITESRVIVTFLSAGNTVELGERGIDSAQAVALRARLKAFEKAWQRPDMDAYDAL